MPADRLATPSPANTPLNTSPTHAGYLDALSGEPLHPEAARVLGETQSTAYADPLRSHAAARSTRWLLDQARESVADALGVRRDEVTFTSSGTDAVHRGLLGLLRGVRRGQEPPVLQHSAVEHSAVFAAARWWQQTSGGVVQSVPVDRHGTVEVAALGRSAAVTAVQHVNPEVGTVQPVGEVAAAVAPQPGGAGERDTNGGLVFVDACAAGARLELPSGWAAAALSAHKWGGPPGVGVLLVRKGARWRSPYPTDDRVDPRVSGFENVPAICAAAAALQARVAERAELNRRDEAFAEQVRAAVAGIDDVEVHGHPTARLPHLVAFSCLYTDGATLVDELSRRGLAVATGSACAATSLEPSHVLEAMGSLTQGNLRVSFARDTSTETVARLCAALPEVVAETRAGLLA